MCNSDADRVYCPNFVRLRRAVQANGNREAAARFACRAFDARPLDALHGLLGAAALELLASEVVAEHSSAATAPTTAIRTAIAQKRVREVDGWVSAILPDPL
jgi:hypothetical protein